MGQDEGFNNEAGPPQLSMFKLLADSKVVALEKAVKRNMRPPLPAFVDGVSTSFLRNHSVCINFNRGKCQDAGPHKHHITDNLLHHQCGACKYAGRTDTSHGSLEVYKCPNRQVFRRE